MYLLKHSPALKVAAGSAHEVQAVGPAPLHVAQVKWQAEHKKKLISLTGQKTLTKTGPTQ